MSERAIAEKKLVVDEIKEKMSRSKVIVISDYLGFSVKEITTLRKKLRPENAEFRVFKNTLVERAAEDSGISEFKDSLKGPIAVLFGYKDAVSPLKTLVSFLKETEKGSIRVGKVESTVFGQSDLTAIAKLPSREVLLAKAIGGLQAPIYGLVNVMQGPLRKLVYVLNSIKEKKGGE